MKRIYQHLEHFQCLLESGEMPMPGIVTTPEGEEIYLGDMLTGLEDLPPRQREAFTLICLQGYTETAATKVMLPNSRWSTPVQQYADTALARMVAAYDKKQAGVLAALIEEEKAKAAAATKPSPPKKRRTVVSVPPAEKTPDTSDVLEKHLRAALDELLDQRKRLDSEITTVQKILKVGS